MNNYLLQIVLLLGVYNLNAQHRWPSFNKADSSIIIHPQRNGQWFAFQMDGLGSDTSYFILTKGEFKTVPDTINLIQHFGHIDSIPYSWDYEYRASYRVPVFEIAPITQILHSNTTEVWKYTGIDEHLDKPNFVYIKTTVIPPLTHRVFTNNCLYQDSLAIVNRMSLVEYPTIAFSKTLLPYILQQKPIEIQAVVGNWTPSKEVFACINPGMGFSANMLQKNLNKFGYELNVNGTYDAATKNALLDFCRKLGYDHLHPNVFWLLRLQDE